MYKRNPLEEFGVVQIINAILLALLFSSSASLMDPTITVSIRRIYTTLIL